MLEFIANRIGMALLEYSLPTAIPINSSVHEGEAVTHAESFVASAAWLLPVAGAAVRAAAGASDQVDAIHPDIVP